MTRTSDPSPSTNSTATPRPWLLVTMLIAWQASGEIPLAFAAEPAAAGVDGASCQLWCISSRQASWPSDEAVPTLDCWRYDESQHSWNASSVAEFLATDEPRVPTSFFVHGNRITHNEAFRLGWQAYRSFAGQAPPGAPFRFVVWSWPSEAVRGLLKDVRFKAKQADAHALYLAWLVDQMDSRVPVSLLGYSFGARLTAGSLHLLGGGTVDGRQMPARAHPDRLPLRVVMMAGALDSSALLPQSHYGRALTQVDRMLVMTNPEDKVLRFYRLLYGLQSRVQAMGAAGVTGFAHSAPPAKISHWNVARWVGPQHDWTRYLLTPQIVTGMRPYWLPAGSQGRELATENAYHEEVAAATASTAQSTSSHD